tara:strand:+ start:403 stop:525 length:123 start_codon:yes stop_codon:yes gene_type:complete
MAEPDTLQMLAVTPLVVAVEQEQLVDQLQVVVLQEVVEMV